MITQERPSSEDRRTMVATPLYPFFDSDDTLVRQDRRFIPERRINNITIEEPIHTQLSITQDEDIGNKRLFTWFHDEIHEVKRADDNA